MARPGRPLEEFVRELQKLLSHSSVEIKSPDFITGRHSQVLREIDVSIREPLGGLTIIECRDRQAPQDVPWIDALIGKADDVSAEKVVAVSPTGFSKGARSMAKAKGIELRTFSEVNYECVARWLPLKHATTAIHYVDITSVKIFHSDIIESRAQENVNSMKSGALIERNADIFIRKSDGKRVTLDAIWRESPHRQSEIENTLAPKEKRRATLVLEYPNSDNCYVIPTGGGLADVTQIDIVGDFYYIEHHIPISRYYDYVDQDGILIRNSEFNFAHEGTNFTFGAHITRDRSQLSITQRSEGGDLDRSGPREIRIDFEVAEHDPEAHNSNPGRRPRWGRPPTPGQCA